MNFETNQPASLLNILPKKITPSKNAHIEARFPTMLGNFFQILATNGS